MNSRIFTIVFFVILFTVMFAKAASAEKKVTYVEQNEVAPFSGVLLTPEAFAELKIKSESNKKEIELQVKYQVESQLLGKQLEIDNLNTKLEWQEIMWKDRLALKNQQIDDLYVTLEKEMKTTVWDRLKGPTHLLAGVALSVGIFYIQSKFTNDYRGLNNGQ